MKRKLQSKHYNNDKTKLLYKINYETTTNNNYYTIVKRHQQNTINKRNGRGLLPGSVGGKMHASSHIEHCYGNILENYKMIKLAKWIT